MPPIGGQALLIDLRLKAGTHAGKDQPAWQLQRDFAALVVNLRKARVFQQCGLDGAHLDRYWADNVDGTSVDVRSATDFFDKFQRELANHTEKDRRTELAVAAELLGQVPAVAK